MRTGPSHVADPGLKGIVLDCDGVILDSFQANSVFYNTLRRGVGLPPMSTEEAAYVHSHSVHESLRRIIPAELRDDLEAVKKQIRYTDLMPYLQLEPGLERFLRTARSKGLRLAICTNRTDTMGTILDHYHLSGFFYPVETAATVTFPKPHPEGLNKILDKWRLSRSEIAFIGDSAVDEQTAASARVRFWTYKNERLRAHVLIPSFDALSRWLLKRDRVI
ncbi:HAD family hydrolase [Desulfonatronum thioautotrophicum]|uniref:HAD family hydrolase n=1 Tax=Desulfonatronum thioautotrophicum TaxID=617001 RepID=UPI0005EB8EE9|nr:HAD family hydrolase [Desulfonatronum thioautotrophicum]